MALRAVHDSKQSFLHLRALHTIEDTRVGIEAAVKEGFGNNIDTTSKEAGIAKHIAKFPEHIEVVGTEMTVEDLEDGWTAIVVAGEK